MKYYLIILGFIIFGCSSNDEAFEDEELSAGIFSVSSPKADFSPTDYIKWIEDPENGLRATKTIGKYSFTVQYKPLNFVALQELGVRDISNEKLKNKKDELQDYQYFTLEIKGVGCKDILAAEIKQNQDYYQRIEYYSFFMQNDLKLVEGNDTMQCVLHHYERNYGVTPYSAFVLAFEDKIKGKRLDDKILIYEDKILGNGTIKIKVSAKDLKRIPELKINNNVEK